MDNQFKRLFLGDPYFEFIGSKTGWTKAQYRDLDTGDPADIPVYTAAHRPVAYVRNRPEMPIQASTTDPVLSFGANGDGSAGTNLIFHERPFFVSNDRTCIRITEPRIHPRYVFHRLRRIKAEYGFDFQYKANKSNTEQVSFLVPITAKGDFDVPAQTESLEAWEGEDCLKADLAAIHAEISRSVVAIEAGYEFGDFELADASRFRMFIGRRLLKRDMLLEGIPAFSANVHIPFGFVAESFLEDFSRPSLIWGIDGIFDWGFIEANRPFYPTDHCGVLQILSDDIVPEYALHVLRATRERYGFDRTLRSSLANISVVSIRVPVVNGLPDTSAQVDLAKRYNEINERRSSVLAALDSIISTDVIR